MAESISESITNSIQKLNPENLINEPEVNTTANESDSGAEIKQVIEGMATGLTGYDISADLAKCSPQIDDVEEE